MARQLGFHVSVTMTDKFALVGALVKEGAAAQTRKAAYAARESMRQHVPVKTGALKQSIEVEKIDSGEYEVSAGDGLERDYAAAVEFGTYKMPAKPYFTPGMEAGRKIMAAKPDKGIR